MQLQDDYLAAYRSLSLTRDSQGVLVAEFLATADRSLSRPKITPSLSMPFTGSSRIDTTRS
jgi:hypothetical protein